MPIFDFMRALKDVPIVVQSAVDDLKYNSLIVVLVGIGKPRNVNHQAVYFAQRICFFTV